MPARKLKIWRRQKAPVDHDVEIGFEFDEVAIDRSTMGPGRFDAAHDARISCRMHAAVHTIDAVPHQLPPARPCRGPQVAHVPGALSDDAGLHVAAGTAGELPLISDHRLAVDHERPGLSDETIDLKCERTRWAQRWR